MAIFTKDIPLYTQSMEYAFAHGEGEKWRKSYAENISCKFAIENALYENRDFDCRIDCDAVWQKVSQDFDPDRIGYVLAYTFQVRANDPQFSDTNKQWGKLVGTYPDFHDRHGKDLNDYFVVRRALTEHIDMFGSYYRRVMNIVVPDISETAKEMEEK